MEIGSKKWIKIIYNGAKAFNVHIETKKVNLFAIHAKELMNWNRKINLTAITDPFEVAVKHFVDSIALVRIIPPDVSVLDIGSGGGFPGIPLKILIPSLSIMLIDASRKKVNFLKHIIRTLNLAGIDAYHIRAEEIAVDHGKAGNLQGHSDDFIERSGIRSEKDFPKSFDVIVSRALFSLNDFISMALPMLAQGGMIVALKGKISEAEIKSARSYLSTFMLASKSRGQDLSLAVTKYRLPFVDDQRSIVMIGSNVRHAFPSPFLKSL